MVEFLFATTISTSRLTQLALAEFIARGYLDRHLRKSGAAYRRRREITLAELEQRVPEVPVTGGPAGLHLSLSFPPGTDESKVLSAAWDRGISLDGNNQHALAPRPPGASFGFASVPETALGHVSGLLAEAIRAG